MEKTSFAELIQEYEGRIYAPHSIFHGHPLTGLMPLRNSTTKEIVTGRLNDFIEYLFEHSVHCDHISQREAWEEFTLWELNNLQPTNNGQ